MCLIKSKLCIAALLVALTVCNPTIYAAEGIVNSNTFIDDQRKITMTRSEFLSVLLTHKIYWYNGTKINVFILPKDSSATKEFLFKLGIPVGAYFDSLNNMYSSGKTNVPIVVNTEISMLVKVSSTAGAIGYIGNPDLARILPNVKIIEIIE